MVENPYESSPSPMVERAIEEADSREVDVASLLRTPIGRLFRFGVCGSPMICLGFCIAFWGVVSAMQGQLAKPNLPDPSSILGGYPATALILLQLGAFAVFPLVIVISWLTRQWFRHAGGYAASLFVSITLSRIDSLGIMNWLSD